MSDRAKSDVLRDFKLLSIRKYIIPSTIEPLNVTIDRSYLWGLSRELA
jgi:hypothetical protein